jgi:hypothetical protein
MRNKRRLFGNTIGETVYESDEDSRRSHYKEYTRGPKSHQQPAQKGVSCVDRRTRHLNFDNEVVYQEDRVKLKLYTPKKKRFKTPLLVIYALINRETMLDLQPKRSVVETLLGEGVEVYMID